MPKSLIAFFSRKGTNYFDGKIIDLPVGNTEVLARKIAALTGGELFHIEAVKPYPADYDESTEVAKIELGENARPKLTGTVPDFDAYDIIYLGYPIWWGVMPMPVLTFLESYNFSGKTIAPFCTHEGSGSGRSERYIRQACPHATVLPGLPIIGHLSDKADKSLEDWLKKRGWLDNDYSALKRSDAVLNEKPARSDPWAYSSSRNAFSSASPSSAISFHQ